MVNALDCGSSGPGSRLGRIVIALGYCTRRVTIKVPFSNKVHKWYKVIQCSRITL